MHEYGNLSQIDPQMMDRIGNGSGFIAALDQSGGSTPRTLEVYGIGRNAYPDSETMFSLIHKMRCRIMTAPSFSNGKIIGAILFERTMDGLVGGKPATLFLRERNIVPFLKIDQGLAERADGVQLMRPIEGLDSLLERATGNGMFGTKMRSVIHRASPSGISAIVEQQFSFAKIILDHGLVPIIEPEVSRTSVERERCDSLLTGELARWLDTIPSPGKVILKLSLPARPNTYAELIDHPCVARVAALSGGYSRAQACTQLARNRGMIASFSRALLEDLRESMNDRQFDHALGRAIDQIFEASTNKSGDVESVAAM